MSFPNKIFLDYGDEKVSSSAKALPLGTTGELPDGRLYRYAKAGAANLSAGYVLQQAGALGAEYVKGLAVATDALSGAETVVLTLGATAVTLNYYADGYLFINAETSSGQAFRVKSCSSAAASSSCTFYLEEGDSLITAGTALAAGTTECGVSRNPFDGLIVATGGTALVGMIAGVPPVPVTATKYFWCQRRGPAAVLAGGTHVVGQYVGMSQAADGALISRITAATAATGTHSDVAIGEVICPAASVDFSLINLWIE